jgi:hypothetical protein
MRWSFKNFSFTIYDLKTTTYKCTYMWSNMKHLHIDMRWFVRVMGVERISSPRTTLRCRCVVHLMRNTGFHLGNRMWTQLVLIPLTVVCWHVGSSGPVGDVSQLFVLAFEKYGGSELPVVCRRSSTAMFFILCVRVGEWYIQLWFIMTYWFIIFVLYNKIYYIVFDTPCVSVVWFMNHRTKNLYAGNLLAAFLLTSRLFSG